MMFDSAPAAAPAAAQNPHMVMDWSWTCARAQVPKLQAIEAKGTKELRPVGCGALDREHLRRSGRPTARMAYRPSCMPS